MVSSTAASSPRLTDGGFTLVPPRAGAPSRVCLPAQPVPTGRWGNHVAVGGWGVMWAWARDIRCSSSARVCISAGVARRGRRSSSAWRRRTIRM